MFAKSMQIYWSVWAVFTLVSFLTPELVMLAIRRPQDTLSANVWRWESFLPGQQVVNWTFLHFAFIVVLLCLDIWLLGHFGWGLWR